MFAAAGRAENIAPEGIAFATGPPELLDDELPKPPKGFGFDEAELLLLLLPPPKMLFDKDFSLKIPPPPEEVLFPPPKRPPDEDELEEALFPPRNGLLD